MQLLACPQCSRQFDVSSLEPGDHVHCVCDHLLDVPQRDLLPVQAFSCTGCGAPVAPELTGCEHCGSALEPFDFQRGTLCPKCYTRLEDDSRHCRSCGIAIAPQNVPTLPAEGACPRCRGSLQVRALEHTSAIECASCKGLWLEAAGFEGICSQAERDTQTVFFAASPEEPAEQANTMGYIPCLRCQELMNRRLFRYKNQGSGVVLDFCKDHGVWFDHEELGRVVAFIREGRGGLSMERPISEEVFRESGSNSPSHLGGSHTVGSRQRLGVVDLLRDLVGGIFS